MAIIRPYYKVYRVFPDPSDYFYIKNEYYGNNTISWAKYGTPNCTDLQYSYDKTTWTNVTDGGNITTMQGGDTVYFRSSTGWSKNSSNYIKFSTTQNCSVGGNLCTLIDYINADTILTIPDYAFFRIFNTLDKLISCENVTLGNATTIGEYSFSNAFYACISLTTCPDFSGVTTIGGYGLSQAFKDCQSLAAVTAPNIQNLTQNNVLESWLYNAGTQATGTKVVNVPTGATITTDSTSGIPTGWTRVDY